METKSRTNSDWSKHKLKIVECKHVTIHELQIPSSSYYRITFINTNGIMAVTGDLYNWMFNRNFFPTIGGYVSDDYWCEKIELASSQVPYEFDPDKTLEELNNALNGGLIEYGWEGEQLKEMEKFTKECIDYTEDKVGYEYYAYREYPNFTDHECVVYCKKIKFSLLVIFDAFEEICKRMQKI